MRIRNIHERRLAASLEASGTLIDGLARDDDRFWPHENWPPMRFDRPLQVGAAGGHGPVRYRVTDYNPGARVVFQFDSKKGLTRGFQGEHHFELRAEGGHTVLRHVIEADCAPFAWLRWHFIVRPLHDALLEDALDKAEVAVGNPQEKPAKWSLWVRLLRRSVRRRPA
jgi:hypothetical protein